MRSSAAASPDPQAVRRLTQSYRTLRGLTQVPLALWFLVKHAALLIGVPLLPGATLILAIPAAAAAFAIHRYYDRRFGVVTRPARSGPGTWLLMLIAFVALQVASTYWALPVQLGFLAVGIAIAVHALRNFEFEAQRLFFAIFFIVVSFWGPSIFELFNEERRYAAAAVAFDAMWIVVALWDHRTLVKAFERARLEDTGGAPSSAR
jgi:hypothetical protein